MIFEQTFHLIRQSHRALVLVSTLVAALIFASENKPLEVRKEAKLLRELAYSEVADNVIKSYLSNIIAYEISLLKKEFKDAIKTNNASWTGDVVIDFRSYMEVPILNYTRVDAVLDYYQGFSNDYLDAFYKHLAFAKHHATWLKEASNKSLHQKLGAQPDEATVTYAFNVQMQYSDKVEHYLQFDFEYDDGSEAYLDTVRVKEVRGVNFPNDGLVSEQFTLHATLFTSADVITNFYELSYAYDDYLTDYFDSNSVDVLESVNEARNLLQESQFYLLDFERIREYSKRNNHTSLLDIDEELESLSGSALELINLPFNISITVEKIYTYFPIAFILLLYYSFIHIAHLRQIIDRIIEVNETLYPAAIFSVSPSAFPMTCLITSIAGFLPIIALLMNKIDLVEALFPWVWVMYLFEFAAISIYCLFLHRVRSELFSVRLALLQAEESAPKESS